MEKCPKCGREWQFHDLDFNLCPTNETEAWRNLSVNYEQALLAIHQLDPGLWLTMQDIANEALGFKPRWRGKSRTPRMETRYAHFRVHGEDKQEAG